MTISDSSSLGTNSVDFRGTFLQGDQNEKCSDLRHGDALSFTFFLGSLAESLDRLRVYS